MKAGIKWFLLFLCNLIKEAFSSSLFPTYTNSIHYQQNNFPCFYKHF